MPLIVASPMFLQNIDTTAIATALPSMAVSLGVPPLHLNLVVTAYLVSLAAFLPMSAWLSERFGARRMFCTAILLFSTASALSGVAGSLGVLVACRVLQGLGAALMLPVGRLILLQSVAPAGMLGAMTWFTVPPVLGRLLGPLVAGAILSVASWQWIFLVNIPLGLVIVLLVLVFVEDVKPEAPPSPFDLSGFLLIAIGLALLLAGLEAAGKGIVPAAVSGLAVVCGVIALGWYGWRSRAMAHPVLDLRILRLRSYRNNLFGAIPLRLAVFAVPFLLPLMLQLGFGLSPLASGVLSSAAGVGALSTRGFIRRALERFGFRRLLLGATAMTGVVYMSYALFSPATPHIVMFGVLFVGGLLGSLCLVSLGTLAFIDVPRERMSHATALSSVVQQLTSGGAVVLAGLMLGLFSGVRGGSGRLHWEDFAATFVVVGLTALLSMLAFRKLKPDVGKDMY